MNHESIVPELARAKTGTMSIRSEIGRFRPNYRFESTPFENLEHWIKSVLFCDEVADPEASSGTAAT